MLTKQKELSVIPLILILCKTPHNNSHDFKSLIDGAASKVQHNHISHDKMLLLCKYELVFTDQYACICVLADCWHPMVTSGH